MNLDPIKRLIKERLGLQFAENAEDALRRALEKRFAGTNAASTTAYLERLQTDEAEWHELASLLTINETYFYREPQHLRLLTGVLTTKLLACQRASGKVRILSVGCSTGEEPYSIAIALREHYGESADRLFQITAGDVDQQALAKARTGVYGAYSFRALPTELAQHYFTTINYQHRQINDTIRRQVSLQHFNVLAETYPPDWFGQDVVFFRNVSIYFDAATRQVIHRRLQTLLNPGGYLIVGATETLSNDFGCMTLQEQDGVFFFVNRPVTPPFAKGGQAGISTMRKLPLCQTGESAIVTVHTPYPGPPPPGGRASYETLSCSTPPPFVGGGWGEGSERLFAIQDSQTVEARYQDALALAREHRFDEALQLLAPLCADDAAGACCWTLRAHLLLERRDAKGATAAVERALALDPWSVDALLLRGRIARLQGDLENAIGACRQVVYHRPDCWPAHYQLAELYRDSGKTELASREYRIVLRQLADRDRAIETAGPLPLAVSMQDLRFLCETQLSRLNKIAG